MLDIRVTIDGDKVILEGLQNFMVEFPGAIQKALTRMGKGVYNEAFKWLQGGSRSRVKMFTKKGKRAQLRGKADLLNARPGSYPVPRVTGNLLHLLNWLMPGASKTTGGITVTAGPFESIIYNSAKYSESIHEGRDTSSKYGRRPFLDDGFKHFNQGNKVVLILNQEIETVIKKTFK